MSTRFELPRILNNANKVLAVNPTETGYVWVDFIQSISVDATGVLGIDNTDPLNPVLEFLGVFTDATLDGDGTQANPLSVVGGGGGVQSVTGLNTDNTDPDNPIVQISVDGSSITGAGTPGDPLVANVSGGNTLDQAYDEGGAGAGRSITADTGAVEITVPDGSANEGLVINQNNTSSTDALNINTAGTGNGIFIQKSGTSNHGGLIKIESSSIESLAKEIEIERINDGARGVRLETMHESTSPAALDTIFAMLHYGRSSTGNKEVYSVLTTSLLDTTDGAEYARVVFDVMRNGSTLDMLEIGSESSDPINGISIGASTEDAVLSSRSNNNLILQTGNATTGSITLEDGANGNINIAPDGTGEAQVGGVEIATVSDTQTMTNKRVTPRVSTIASSATPTPPGDDCDVFTVTALATNATFAAPTGTPTEGQKLIVRILDDGTARTLAWNAIYREIGTSLPTTTTISKTMYLGFMYNSADSKWDLIAFNEEV